jgi:hypothetical protein
METKKLIRITKGIGVGRYLILDEKKNCIIHENGYVSEGCVLPWNCAWRVSKRKMPRWAVEMLKPTSENGY